MKERCPFCGHKLRSQPCNLKVPKIDGLYQIKDIGESPDCPKCGAKYLKGQDKNIQAIRRRREIALEIKSNLDNIKEQIEKMEKEIKILTK